MGFERNHSQRPGAANAKVNFKNSIAENSVSLNAYPFCLFQNKKLSPAGDGFLPCLCGLYWTDWTGPGAILYNTEELYAQWGRMANNA